MQESKYKVIAITNQKGGVEKTTTTFTFGIALAKLGKRVLVIDVDPQSNLTAYAGWYNEDEFKYTLSYLMEQSMNDEEIKTKESILHHKENVDLISSSLNLSALETSLAYAMSREYTLRNCLSVVKNDYGNIKIKEITNVCNINADCGNVEIDTLSIKENSIFKSDYGNIKINNTNDIYIDAEVDFGKAIINGNNRYAEIILKIECSCGNVEVNN